MSALARRLDALERQSEPALPPLVLFCERGESSEERERRHYDEYPEDRGREALVVCWIEVIDGRPA